MKAHPTTPRPESLAAISKRTGTARQTLRKWRDEEGVNIYLESELQARIARRQPAGPPQDQADDGNGESQSSARRRREIALANLAELKVAEAEARLVDVGTVRDVATRLGAVFRAALGRLQADLPPMLDGMTPGQMKTLIGEKTDEILRAISESSPDFWK